MVIRTAPMQHPHNLQPPDGMPQGAKIPYVSRGTPSGAEPMILVLLFKRLTSSPIGSWAKTQQRLGPWSFPLYLSSSSLFFNFPLPLNLCFRVLSLHLLLRKLSCRQLMRAELKAWENSLKPKWPASSTPASPQVPEHGWACAEDTVPTKKCRRMFSIPLFTP